MKQRKNTGKVEVFVPGLGWIPKADYDKMSASVKKEAEEKVKEADEEKKKYKKEWDKKNQNQKE